MKRWTRLVSGILMICMLLCSAGFAGEVWDINMVWAPEVERIDVRCSGTDGSNLDVGEQTDLMLRFTPEQAVCSVTYKSSDTKVAKVDEYGKVTAVAPGQADITVRAKNGVRGSVTVHVTAKDGVLTYKKLADGSGYRITGCDASVSAVRIPASYQGLPVTAIDGQAFLKCENLKRFLTEKGQTAFYTDDDGVLYSDASGKRVLVRFPNRYKNDGSASYKVLSGTVEIAPYAFAGLQQLGSLHLPEGVQTIGDYALAEVACQVFVYLPDSVSSIGEHLLQGQKDNVPFYAHEDTYAHQFAYSHSIPFGIIPRDPEDAPEDDPAEETDADTKDAKRAKDPDKKHILEITDRTPLGNQVYPLNLGTVLNLKEYQKDSPSEIQIQLAGVWSAIAVPSGETTRNGYPAQTGLYGAGYTKGETWLRGYDLEGNVTGIRKVSGHFIFSLPGAYNLGVSGGEDTVLTALPYKPVFISGAGILPLDPSAFYSAPDGKKFQLYVIMLPDPAISFQFRGYLNCVSYSLADVSGSQEMNSCYGILGLSLKDPELFSRMHLATVHFDGMKSLYEDSEFSCYAKISYQLDKEYGKKLREILKTVKSIMTAHYYPSDASISPIRVLINGQYPSSFQSVIFLDEYFVPHSDRNAVSIAHEMVHAVDQSHDGISNLSPSPWMEGRAEYISFLVAKEMGTPYDNNYNDSFDWSFLSAQDKADFFEYYYEATNRETEYPVGYFFMKFLCDTYGKNVTSRITKRLIQSDGTGGSDHEKCKKLFKAAVIAETEENVFQQFVRVVIDGKEPKIVDETKADGGIYTLNHQEKTAAFRKAADKNASALNIKATVRANGTTYKVTGISDGACKGMAKLKKATIGKNVTTIGPNAFGKCAALKTVKGGAAVTSIGDSAFSGCTSLKSFPALAKLKTIGAYAFKGCVKLASFTLEKAVQSIGKGAFSACEGLKKIIVLTTGLTEKKIGKGCFSGIFSKASFQVPKKMLKKYKDWFVRIGKASKKATFTK